MEIINLDMTPSTVTPNAHAGQYDSARTIRFMLKNGGVPFTLAGTETITAEITRSDNTEVTVNVANTSSNYVDVVFDDTVCTVKGLYACELRVVDGGVDIGSKNFALLVQRDPYDGAGVHVVTVGPADICTFETTLPETLQSVTVNIVATGGYDADTQTAHPIVGYSSANITRCGVNLWELDNTCIGKNYDGYANVKRYSQTIKMPLTTYTFCRKGSFSNFSDVYVGISKKPIGNTLNLNSDTQRYSISSDTYKTVTTTSEYPYLFILAITNQEEMTETIMNELQLMISVGSSVPTSYHPYNGQTYTIAFGQTVYGGVLDVTRGKLKPCIEYPSYNGETLSGRWLSSEATYVEGTTPPTGSQVVSLDDYGSDIDLTPKVISAIVGENNVFADCGETTVKYLKAGE